MKNGYIIDGDIATVILNKNKTVKIDIGDLETIKSFDGNWIMNDSNPKRIEYAYGSSSNKMVLMHRLIMHPPSNKVVDHINGDGLDNRRSNLRVVTQAQNLQNRTMNRNNSSGVSGIYFDKHHCKWVARLRRNGEIVYRKRFDSLRDAEINIKIQRAKLLPFSKEAAQLDKA